MVKSFRGRKRHQETNDERRLIDGIMERAVDVMTSEVGDDRTCQRREPADSGKMARDRAVHETS